MAVCKNFLASQAQKNWKDEKIECWLRCMRKGLVSGTWLIRTIWTGTVKRWKDYKQKGKGLAKLGNVVAETLSLVMFPWVAKLAGNKQRCFAAPVAKREKHCCENKCATHACNDKLASTCTCRNPPSWTQLSDINKSVCEYATSLLSLFM